METKKFVQSKKFRVLTIAVGTIAVALIIFWAGVAVGYHVAGFSYRFGDNYYRIFQDHRPGNLDIMHTELPGGHGATGSVASVALPNIIITEADKTEKIILVTGTTIIRSGQNTITAADIHTGDFIVVVGSPDTNSQIDAEFIRIVPAPTDGIATSTQTGSEQNN